MTIEEISAVNMQSAARLMLQLWEDARFAEELDNCKRMLQEDRETVFLANVDGDYVGFIYLNMREDYVEGTTSSPVVYIEGIYVRPDYRKQGIGKQLVTVGAHWGKARGAIEYASDVEWPNQESIDFHKRIGFQEVNRVVCFARRLDGT